MGAKRVWSVQSLLTCFFWNAVLIGLLYFMADKVIDGMRQWVDPVVKPEGAVSPEEVRSALSNLTPFLAQTKAYLAPVMLGLGGLVTFILWLFVMAQGRGLARRVQEAAESRLSSPGAEAEKPAPKPDKPASPVPAEPPAPSPQPVLQLLSGLQREGRFVDFLQENLDLYDDAQVGAVVRSVHKGCRRALSDYLDLKPIYEEKEGAEVSVPPNFDVNSIRLTGNVSGDPPFRGILRHRGWKAVKVRLPKASPGRDKDPVLAPAEVEIGGGAG